jgi:kinetochore protein Spc7/SPC105
MQYKSQLQLFLHPNAFITASNQPPTIRPNSPISLTYIARHRDQKPKELTTTLRFFLQLLRASLHALPQCTTSTKDLLHLISTGWGTALTVAESERRLNIECPTESRIISDERLAIESTLLLPKVRTKIRTCFEIFANVTEALEMDTNVNVATKVVYGEPYDEKKMTGAVGKVVGGGLEGWAEALRDLKGRLVKQGGKGMRR